MGMGLSVCLSGTKSCTISTAQIQLALQLQETHESLKLFLRELNWAAAGSATKMQPIRTKTLQLLWKGFPSMITALSCIGSSTKSKNTHNNNELRSQTMLTAQTLLLKRNNSNNNNPFLILSPPPSLPFPSLPSSSPQQQQQQHLVIFIKEMEPASKQPDNRSRLLSV